MAQDNITFKFETSPGSPMNIEATVGKACPDCKGKGVIELLTSTVPCNCRSYPERFGPSPFAELDFSAVTFIDSLDFSKWLPTQFSEIKPGMMLLHSDPETGRIGFCKVANVDLRWAVICSAAEYRVLYVDEWNPAEWRSQSHQNPRGRL